MRPARAVWLLLLAGLAACGQRGPLFLPEPPTDRVPQAEEPADEDDERATEPTRDESR